jgi:hypothetical protein
MRRMYAREMHARMTDVELINAIEIINRSLQSKKFSKHEFDLELNVYGSISARGIS